jgi:hypothetical protein
VYHLGVKLAKSFLSDLLPTTVLILSDSPAKDCVALTHKLREQEALDAAQTRVMPEEACDAGSVPTGFVLSLAVHSAKGPVYVSPIQCSNSDSLQVVSYILREQLDRWGYTWRAVRGYNGAVEYIELVHTNLCQRESSPLCQSERRPSPTDSLHPMTSADAVTTLVSIAAPISVADGRLTTPAALDGPDASPRWLDHLPSARTMFLVTIRILAPFIWFIGMILLFCYGLRIIFWAIGMVRDSFFGLLRGQRTSFSHPLHRSL